MRRGPIQSAHSTTQIFTCLWIHLLGRSLGLSLSSSGGLKEGMGGDDLLPLRNGSWDPDEISMWECQQLLEAGPSGQPRGGAGVHKANVAQPHRHLLTALHHAGNCFSWHSGVAGELDSFLSNSLLTSKWKGWKVKRNKSGRICRFQNRFHVQDVEECPGGYRLLQVAEVWSGSMTSKRRNDLD